MTSLTECAANLRQIQADSARDECLALLRQAHSYVGKYPSIGAQELSAKIAEHLAKQQGDQ